MFPKTVFKNLYLISLCERLKFTSVEIIYLRTLKTHHHIFAFFLQTVYAIEKLLAGFNVQPRIGMNQSLI